jgi:pimeloyl-ACP methyl ester carboxylesterase
MEATRAVGDGVSSDAADDLAGPVAHDAKTELFRRLQERRLAARMPHARVEVVRDASHLVWLDQPAACADAVSAFLDE